MKKFLIFLTILSIGTSLYGQEFCFPLYLEDSTGHKDTLLFGYDTDATDSIDALFGETNIKTLSFDTVFEARISDWYNENLLPYSDDPTTYHLKKQIQKKDCTGSDWPFASGIILSNVKFPIKVYWDSTLFSDSCKQNSLITDWYPGNWFDAAYGTEQGPFYLKAHDTVSFAYTTHTSVTTNNDTLYFLYLTLANVYNFSVGTEEIREPMINLFPVPATDHLTLQLLDPKLKVRTVQLFDIVGKGQQLILKDNNIDLREISKGLYFISLTFENGQIVTKKIIKN